MDDGARRFDIRPVFRLLRDGRWILLAGALVGTVLFGLYAVLLSAPEYRATTVVILDEPDSHPIDPGTAPADPFATEARMNTEAEVLQARTLLGEVTDRLALADDPEFNAALRPPAWSDQITGPLRASLPFMATPDQDPALQPPREAAITALQGQIAVVPVPSSFVIRITAVSTDPTKAARIADALAEAYLAGQIAREAAAIDTATKALAAQAAALSDALVLPETAQTAHATVPQQDTPPALLGSLLPDGAPPATAAAPRRAEAPAHSPSAHSQPDAQAADSAPSAAQAPLSPATAERAENRSEIALIHGLYEVLLMRLGELKVQREMIRPDSRILSQAVVPTAPATPQRAQMMTLGLLAGLAASGAIIVLRAGLTATFRRPEEVEAATGLHVVVSLPEIAGAGGREILRALAERPLSPETEAIRMLRTSLSAEPGGPLPGVIMLTSALPEEGKTTVAAALAQNLAAVGLSVVLVETDLRRRAFGQFFGPAPAGGLVSVISGEAGVEQMIYTAEPFGFDVLAGITGSQAGLPDLLASDRFDDLMAVLRTGYDVVLLDTTPLLTAPDARIIGRHAEAVVYCLRWNDTTRDEVRRSLRLLDGIGRQPPAIVLTRVTERMKGRLI